MLHSEFDYGRRNAVLDWVEQFANNTEQLGHTVRRFDPRVNRLTDFDWIHAFWRLEAETWASAKKSGVPLSVTPSLAEWSREPAGSQGGPFPESLRMGRALLQRRWPPIDEEYFRARADRYFVLSDRWRKHLQDQWKIESNRIEILGNSPAVAATAFSSALAKL